MSHTKEFFNSRAAICSYTNKYVKSTFENPGQNGPVYKKDDKITYWQIHPNNQTKVRRALKRFNIPVIGYFKDRTVEFQSILQAEQITGIRYNLIFESCIGIIRRAKGVRWEFKKGSHYIKYKALYMTAQVNRPQHEQH